MFRKFSVLFVIVVSLYFGNKEVVKKEKISQIKMLKQELEELSSFQTYLFYNNLCKNGTTNHEVLLSTNSSIGNASYSPTYNTIYIRTTKLSDDFKTLSGPQAISKKSRSDRAHRDMVKNASYKINPEDLPVEFLTFLHEYGHSLTISKANMSSYSRELVKIRESMSKYKKNKHYEFIAFNTGDLDNFTYDSSYHSTFYRFSNRYETMADRYAMESIFKHVKVYRALLGKVRLSENEYQKFRKDNMKMAMKIKKDLYF